MLEVTYPHSLESVVSVSERLMQTHEALRDCPAVKALRMIHTVGWILSPRAKLEAQQWSGEGSMELGKLPLCH